MKNNKQFEFFPHTADVRLKVFGDTKEEVFKNALLGMAEILKKSASKSDFEPRSPTSNLIKVQSLDINSLLVDFLSEVLYQSQINHAVFPKVKFLKFNDPSTGSGQVELEAEIFGSKVDVFDEDIKAVTYHGLEIKKSSSGGFETIIVFDI